MKKGTWQEAVNSFLLGWKKRKEVTGALVCGSYVTGNPSEHSDIDLHIVLSEKTKWRERGNVFVNGYLIEYFANPPGQIKNYFEEDHKDNAYLSPVMFISGKILFDKKGDVVKLRKLAATFKAKPFPALDKISLELKKYALWDALDNLKDNYGKNRSDFYYIYYNALRKIYEVYAAYLRVPVNSPDRTLSLLADGVALKKYLQSAFPDRIFVNLFIDSIKIDKRDAMLKNFERISAHVFYAMGGFAIDGWKIRSPVDKKSIWND